MNALQRSWEITKLSFDVIKKDKELVLFPILGGIFSLLFVLALAFPIILTSFVPIGLIGSYFWIALFLMCFGIVFISIFFNVATVHTVKKRFDGGNATFWESIRFALSRLHLIIAWSIISSIIGILLRLLENIAEKMGGLGEIVMKIIIGFLGLGWGLLSAFVIPGMVYKNIGPIDALKGSAHALKKTWGESLIKYYGLGLVQFIMILIGIIATIFLVIVTAAIPVLSIILGIIGIVYIIAVITFFNIASSVFNTALYVYATTGKSPHGYKDEILRHAFERKKTE